MCMSPGCSGSKPSSLPRGTYAPKKPAPFRASAARAAGSSTFRGGSNVYGKPTVRMSFNKRAT